MNRLLVSALAATTILASACGEHSGDTTAAADLGADEPELKSGEASIVVPLIDEKKKLLSKYNAQAKAKGLKETPDTFEVKTQADAKKYSDLRDYFANTVMEAVGAKTQPMPSWGPDSYTNWSKSLKTPGLCYRGNPTKVVSVIQNSTDTVFSDQLVIQGWKYKKTTKFSDGVEEFEADFPDVWKEWRGDSNALLVVFSQSDDGDDLTPAIIPLCH